MKKILILIFVALSIGAGVALKMYREGEHDIGFMAAMALAMVVAIAIAAPKHFDVLSDDEISPTHNEYPSFSDGFSKPIVKIAVAILLVVVPIAMYLQGVRKFELIALGTVGVALVPFYIYWDIQRTKWRFENDKSLYEHQPDLQARFSIPLEGKQDKSDVKDN